MSSQQAQTLAILAGKLSTRLFFVAALIGVGALVIDYSRVLIRRRKLPPGPFPWPFFGNHFQIPKERPWIEWEHWAKHYDSPLLTIWLGNEPRIIVSDAWTASDLMEKRADIWSSRPRLIAMGDAINATNTNQTTLPYGDRWRLHRRLMVIRHLFSKWKSLLMSCSILPLGHKLSGDIVAFRRTNPNCLLETSSSILKTM